MVSVVSLAAAVFWHERCVTCQKTAAARESMVSDAYLKKTLNVTTSIQEDRVFTAGKKCPLSVQRLRPISLKANA